MTRISLQNCSSFTTSNSQKHTEQEVFFTQVYIKNKIAMTNIIDSFIIIFYYHHFRKTPSIPCIHVPFLKKALNKLILTCNMVRRGFVVTSYYWDKEDAE